MKKLLFSLSFFLFLSSVTWAQTLPVTFAWDPSATSGTIDNPIKYRLCTSPTAPTTWPVGGVPTDRIINEAGTALEFKLNMAVGTFYIFATAFNYGLSVDNVLDPTKIQESGPSNVLKVVITAPPGNPSKVRLKSVTTVAGTTSGSLLGVNH